MATMRIVIGDIIEGKQMVYRLCAWCGIFGATLEFIALFPAMHFFPPMPANWNAAEVVAFYQQHLTGIRVGSILLVIGVSLLMPFFAAISGLMAKMEQRPFVLAMAQLALAVVGFLPVIVSAILFATAAFRIERAPELIYLLNDLGWMMFVMPAAAPGVQLVIIGFAILGDNKHSPVIPRWVAYVNFWCGLLFVPGVVVPLFKVGPFAWHGLLAYWVPFGAFGVWLMVMLWVVNRHVEQTSSQSTLLR